MTDFNILRKRYSEVLCGRGHSGKRTADCILRSDERTEQRLAQLDTRIKYFIFYIFIMIESRVILRK